MNVVAALGSVAAILTSIYWVYRLVLWSASQTPEQDKEAIDQKVSDEEKKVIQTGRPAP